MLSTKQKRTKRCVDLLLSSIGIVIFTVPIFILVIISTIVHQEFGVFFQKRVGKNAKIFTVYKVKSMRFKKESAITSFGNFIRKTKLDELLQVFNVFFGHMSIVGPRPDILGYADKLKGEDKIILSVKPGLTSLAALKFANEELLLKSQNNPLVYNDLVLWPQKVALNKQYITNWSLFNDFKVIGKTILFFLGFNQTTH
jgi:lipopolysaccharide/colanic/teichoic acid biosynthesis glycosyltransferase